jgi:hypothetical protein
MKDSERKAMRGTISSWGPRWAMLDRVEFSYSKATRVPHEWRIFDPKSGSQFESAAHNRGDANSPTASLIPLPFRKVLILNSSRNFIRGTWSRRVVLARMADGATRNLYERSGYELELVVDVDDFVLEATSRSLLREDGLIASGFRVLVDSC